MKIHENKGKFRKIKHDPLTVLLANGQLLHVTGMLIPPHREPLFKVQANKWKEQQIKTEKTP